MERGLFPPVLCRAQPSAPLQGTAQGSPCLAAPAGTQDRAPCAHIQRQVVPRSQEPAVSRSGVKHLHRRSYSLPGLAGIGEAFQRLKWAGAFGCQEVEVRKALELVMEGPELPESSGSGHQTCGSAGKGSELSLLQRGSRCHLIYEEMLPNALLWLCQSSHFSRKVLNPVPSNSPSGACFGQKTSLPAQPKPHPGHSSAVFPATPQHRRVLIPRPHLSPHTSLHAACKPQYLTLSCLKCCLWNN